jgi:hypothetical protein
LETLNYLRLSRRSRFRLDENNVSSLVKFSGFQYTNIPFSTSVHKYRPQPTLTEPNLVHPARVSTFKDIVRNIGVKKHANRNKDDAPSLSSTTSTNYRTKDDAFPSLSSTTSTNYRNKDDAFPSLSSTTSTNAMTRVNRAWDF